MKNNTKLIMETWRRFLKEGPQDDPGQYQDPDDHIEGEPLEGDEDLENLPAEDDLESGPFDREVQGGGPNGEYIPDEAIVDVIRQEIDANPSITDEELMQKVPEAYPEDIEAARNFQDVSYDNEYESRSTFDDMSEEGYYDEDDSSDDFDPEY